MDNDAMGFVQTSVTTNDAATLASLQQRIWATKYESIPTLLAITNDGHREDAWRELIESGLSTVLIATNAQREPVGYLVGVSGARDAEIEALEIDPSVLRQGHGSRLMHAFVDLSTSASSASMWCDVADHILRNFLQSAGWGPDGAHRVIESEDGSQLRQIHMVTDTGPDDRAGHKRPGESPVPAG